MPQTLRDYQSDLISRTYRAMNAGDRHVIAQLSTGGGKSVIGAKVGQDCSDRKNHLLWIVHRRELVQQAAVHLIMGGLDPAFIMAGEKPDPDKPVQIASLASLARRRKPHADLVVYDEVHHSASESAQKILNHYKDAFWLGLTATPCRLDGRGLGHVGWDRIVQGPSSRWLIENEFLADYDYYSPDRPEMTGVKTGGGDFNRRESEERMNVIVGKAHEWYLDLMPGRQAIVFCATVEQSRKIERQFTDAGVTCEHADAKTPEKERADIMRRFRSGEVSVLTNVQLVDEGFDVPECDGVIIARPTKSLVFHRQSCGRALRPKRDGRRAIIIDMAGNATRLGLPCAEVDWSLDGHHREQVKNPFMCGTCGLTTRIKPRVCPRCETEHPVEEVNRTPQSTRGELVKFSGTPEEVSEQKGSMYERFLIQARRNGWKLGSASQRYKGQTGVWPRGPWLAAARKRELAKCEHVRYEDGKCRFCGADEDTFLSRSLQGL